MSIIAFLIAKAHANHSRSPTASQINGMITADTISDAETILQRSSYGSIYNEVRPSVNLPEYEVKMRIQYAQLLRIYRNAAIGKVKDMLNAYTLTIEAENMDMIFQAIMRDNVDEELEQIIIPVGKFGMRHYKRIMENTDPKIATDYIIYPELKNAAQKALNQSNDPDDQIFLLSAAFSHTAYSALSKIAPKWVRLEVDFLNLETICRAINLDIDVSGWLIPDIGTIYPQRQRLRNMNTPRDAIAAAANRFLVSQPLKAALDADDPVSQLETEVLQYLYFQRYRNFIIHGNRPEAILDYFSIKHAEMEDISRIFTSKVLTKTSNDDLRRMIYPIYRS
ncbi:MAG: V0D/AC39 family V-type ATPase subunit [Candidatus Kariarchaeaceae archaeon]|jgi:vacuolar-type H+-ATPase subunit C/Vma6